MHTALRAVVRTAVASAAAVVATAAGAAPPVKAPPAVIAPGARAQTVRPPLPFDISIDSVTIGWSPMHVVALVRTQGEDPGRAHEDRQLTCWFTYSGFPPGSLAPPSGGGAYVFTEPAKKEMKVVAYRVGDGPTHPARIPFATVANEVRVHCLAWPDEAESDKANNTRDAFSTRPPPPGQPPTYLLEVSATPLNDPGNHLKVLVRFTNPTPNLLQNLRLILVKNHLAMKEWKPLGIHPNGLAQVHVQDAMPAAGASNHYEAILTTDLASPVPPPASILDRRSASYHRGGTVRGGP
jgi:hypothetical protein